MGHLRNGFLGAERVSGAGIRHAKRTCKEHAAFLAELHRGK